MGTGISSQIGTNLIHRENVNSAVRTFEISNRIVTSVFDLIRHEQNYSKIFEYLPSPISYLFNRIMPIFYLSNNA